jgi:uncharacterized damage-inducible protein DinB/ribosomal protein S18 acetylase RimI-like enzyme
MARGVPISVLRIRWMSIDLLERLLGHDSWTTRRFLEIATSLSDEELDRGFDIGQGTVRRTFEHLIWNIECWTDLMKGESVRSRAPHAQPINALIDRFEAASSQFTEFSREVEDQGRLNDVFIDTLDDPPQQKNIGTTIVHVATHGMHHRAQLKIMMRQLGVEHLPEGDALGWEAALKSEAISKEPALSRQENDVAPTDADLIDDAPTDAEMETLDSRLTEFNKANTGRDDYSPLRLVIRDHDRSMIAGLKAITVWDWLYVEMLWVSENHRRSGFGSRLLKHAERVAKDRGCIGSCLSSFTFQAPEFYEKHGYGIFGQIENYPDDSSIFFFSKRF